MCCDPSSEPSHWSMQNQQKLSLIISKYSLLSRAPRPTSMINTCTVQILCIGTDRSQQTVQTKIRLLLKKQFDQGLCCLPLHQLLLDALMQCYIKFTNFRTIMAIVWGVPNFRIFTVSSYQDFLCNSAFYWDFSSKPSDGTDRKQLVKDQSKQKARGTIKSWQRPNMTVSVGSPVKIVHTILLPAKTLSRKHNHFCRRNLGWMNGWLVILCPFQQYSVISGQWEDDNERLCAMVPYLRLRRFCLKLGSNSGPLDQQASI